jgi:hypothetical protein
MESKLIFVILWSLPFALNAQKAYMLVNDGGIYVEQYDSSYTDENRYTEDNVTYKQGKVNIYSYYYTTPV